MSSPEPDIIVAVASAPGGGPRGIVRLSGPGLPEALGFLITLTPLRDDERWAAAATSAAVPRGVVRATLGSLPASAGVPEALPCLALVLRGPASYTGEDGLELYPPGSPAVLEAIMRGLIEGGRAAGLDIGPAGPGDFSLRAWRNGRLDLVEAESVAALIAAGDESELRAVRNVSGGAFVHRVESLASEVATTLARLEAGIDFADEEDVVILAADALGRRLDEHREALAEVRDAGGRREAAADVPRVVLTGPPNAGKSTLFNALLGREAAIVADEAGTTRDVLEMHARIADTGRPIILADAAGLDADDRAGGGGARAAAQDRTASALAAADLRVACVPVDRPIGEHVAAALAAGSAVDGAGGRIGETRLGSTIIVRTMLDRLGEPPDRRRAVDHATGDAWVSAPRGAGMRKLAELIDRRLEALRPEGGGPVTGLLARHRAAVSAAHARLEEAGELVAGDRRARPQGAVTEPELLAAVLREALDHLGTISGARSADDVLGLVFGSFCIGK